MRLVAVSTDHRDGRRIITIEIEAGSAYHVAYAMEALERVRAGQNGSEISYEVTNGRAYGVAIGLLDRNEALDVAMPKLAKSDGHPPWT